MAVSRSNEQSPVSHWMSLKSVHFEVFGRVQGTLLFLRLYAAQPATLTAILLAHMHMYTTLGVFFRKVRQAEGKHFSLSLSPSYAPSLPPSLPPPLLQHTRDAARKHGLVGWVKNTGRDTVVGVAQGEGSQVEALYVPYIRSPAQ